MVDRRLAPNPSLRLHPVRPSHRWRACPHHLTLALVTSFALANDVGEVWSLVCLPHVLESGLAVEVPVSMPPAGQASAKCLPPLK